MLARPDPEQLTIENSIADVGRMMMSSGAGVWIVATEHATRPEYEADMADLRREVLEHVPDGTAAVRGWAWGEMDDGVPQLLDLSGVDARTDGDSPASSLDPDAGWFDYGELR